MNNLFRSMEPISFVFEMKANFFVTEKILTHRLRFENFVTPDWSLFTPFCLTYYSMKFFQNWLYGVWVCKFLPLMVANFLFSQKSTFQALKALQSNSCSTICQVLSFHSVCF